MKKLAILIASSAILALAAAGCGKAGTAANQPADSAKEAAVGQSAGTSAEAAAEQSAGTSAETAAEQPAGKTGMQIASAWLINGDDETRTYVTIDLSGGWSVEFAPGEFYLYENMQSKEDESSAMGITLSEEVYDEYADEAEESDSRKELGDAVMYVDDSGESVYLFTVGDNGYFRLSVKPGVDSDAVFRRVTAEEEESSIAALYGKDSELYTLEEMDDAVDIIMEEFDDWTGCEMNGITYAGDECNSEENIERMNELAEEEDYIECIEFLTDFHSSEDEEDLEDLSLEPDTDYTDYQWWLARTEDGEWELVTWGE